MIAARLQLAAVLLLSMTAVHAELLTPFSAMGVGEVAAPWHLQGIRGRPPAAFRIVERDGPVVEAVAAAAVASLLHPVSADPLTASTLRWRWQIVDPVEGSDIYRRAGDDFPARVYVLFDYDLSRLSLGERWKLRFARLVYGDWVPGAALCYVPARNLETGTMLPNAYSDRIRMVVVDSFAHSGDWQSFSRNIAQDYQSAFSEAAPQIIGIAIAIDTDDTRETARAYFGDVSLAP